jgi:TRAP-type C4-dicarboxylate transport system permease small subunit
MKFLDKIEEYIMIIAFPLMVLFITLSTTFRYFELGSIPWAEEASRYLMILMAFAGISLGFKNNSHIGMSFIVDKMPPEIRKWFIMLRNIIIVGFGLLTSYYTFEIIQKQLKFVQKSPSMGLPMWCVYMPMLWGSIMIIIRAIQAVIVKKEESQEVL